MAQTETQTETQTEPKPQRRRITKRKATEAHARSYFDAIARRDPQAIGEHWADDGVEDIVPLSVLRGRDEIVSFFRDLFAAVPDADMRVTRLVAGDSEAAVEWRMTGNFTGAPFQGIDPTGKPVDMRGFDLLEIADGRNVSNTGYYDGMEFARQVGLMPPQDSGAERAMKSAFNAATKVRRAVAERRAGR